MITPWYVGQTSPVWTPLLVRDGGTAVDLTNVNAATLTLNIHNQRSNSDVAGVGTFSILVNNPAQIQYTWATADSANPGLYTLQVSYTDTSSRIVDCDPVPWEVRAKGQLSV